MRLHTNHVTTAHVRAAVSLVPGLTIDSLSTHRSTTHDHALDIKLDAVDKGHGRRRGNSGAYGARASDSDGYAPMWDEWGIVIAALYLIDPDASWGTPGSPIYPDAPEFHYVTAGRFRLTSVVDGEVTGAAFVLTHRGQAIVDAPHVHRWESPGGPDLVCKGTPSRGIECSAELIRA